MKNTYRKLLPIFCLIVLFTIVLSVSAFAEPTVAVSSTEFYSHESETFTTTLYIPDNANIVDFDITLNYDTDLLTLVSVAENEDIKGTVVYNDQTAGKISINYTRTSKNVTSRLPLLDITFKIDDNIGLGTYDCMSVDKSAKYVAHRLTDSGALEKVDFSCDFAELIIYEMGDVDLSGEVDIGDATYLRRHLAEIDGAVLEGFRLSLADALCDGVIDIGDPVTLQRRLAGFDVVYGNRVNIIFYNLDGEKYVAKSVLYDGTLKNIPLVPINEGYFGGVWSLSPDEYIAPDFKNLKENMKVYVFYTGQEDKAMDYYKERLTKEYYNGDIATNLCSDLHLKDRIDYQNGCYATIIWSSDSNYVLNSTTGVFTKPTYPQDLTLTATITSYDSKNMICSESEISFEYDVPGIYLTPTKQEIADFLDHYFTDDTDGQYRINYDAKLIAKLNNAVLPVDGAMYDNFEVRLSWYQNVNGELKPISQVKRTTSAQVNDYVAVATFNGKPIDGDGKIYFDDVEVTPIEQIEIKNYIINQIAARMGTIATNNTELWNNDTVYGTNVTWESGATDIAYVENNVIKLKNDAINGSTLPLNARVSYAVDGDTEEFVLAYNLMVSSDNTKIKAPENMDPELYKAIKMELEDNLGYRGDLTSAALADVRFVNLDLSDYPDITSLRGLSYCKNLRTLNISGLHITDGTMNQIATLSYLEAFVARGCGLDNLSDGGQATLRNAVNLKLIDLTDNNFTSLDSVFAEGMRYGKLSEVYLSGNRLTDINALQRAPMMTYLSLSDNGLTTEGTACIEKYPYLTYLSLANNNIDSVEHLSGLKHLTELRLQNNNISNVNDLRKLINLEALYIGHNKIKDIGNLNTLTNLEILYANDNNVFDISNLKDLTKLSIINLNNNDISSFSVLAKYKSTLTEIYAENNKATDFSFINGAENLSVLMLAGNKMELAQDNMSTWLSGLNKLKILTLSDIHLNDLSFLEPMTELARLDVDNCGLNAFSGEFSNIKAIADKYSTLRVLNISNNDFSDSESEVLNLRNVTLLTVFYADNICKNLDAYTLTYSMTELKCVSLENCGITTMNWLSKFNDLEYVDLSGNNISEVSIEGFISNASLKSIKELYLDTNENCSFANVFRVMDFNVEKLSLAGISIEQVEHLSNLEHIKYLNLSNTGLTSLTSEDPELADMYSVERYKTLETIDVSGLETDISPIENLKNLKTVYAVGATDSKLFCKDDLRALQRLYNKGVTCYLYDKQTKYEPVAETEGKKILNLLDDFSCDVTVAADNILSNSNPELPATVNDFDITWTVSNPYNYEVVNNKLAVKNYEGIENEKLTLTASITVYPDQAPVSRSFTINTNILRANPAYFNVFAEGYSEQLTRESVFNYDLTLKAAETEGFSVPVKPVEDNITYTYSAVAEDGRPVTYANVITDNGNHNYTILPTAQLETTITMCITISHNSKSGEAIIDADPISASVLVATRTFTANFVLDGGTLVDANGLNRESCAYKEDALLFNGLTLSKPGYEFEGWYTDEAFENLFSADGEGATMPSNDITLYAKWRAVSYVLAFDANGGTVEPTSIRVLSDVAIGELPIPTREQYTFVGWFDTSGKEVTCDTKYASTTDVTIFAKWTPNEYTATWNSVDGVTIAVERSESPNAKAEIGTIKCGDVVYYGDVLKVNYTERVGYTIKATGTTTITVSKDVTPEDIFAEASVNSYTATWSTGTGYSIAVERTSSPHANQELGKLSSGASVYYGDVLSVTYKASTGYSLSKTGVESITVVGDITSSDIFAGASPNSYTYDIVYKSVHGTNLGTSTATYKYGTTNTISAPSKPGYTTPPSQSVKWDSTTAKTITFTYGIVSQSTTQSAASGWWWAAGNNTGVSYSASIQYQNRTASSVQVRVVWTQSIKSAAYGYNQWFYASCGGQNTGSVKIASTSTWPYYGSSGPWHTASVSVNSGWMTVPVSATATSVTVACDWWTDSASQSGSWSKTISIPTY